MKNHELIKALSELPPDLEVCGYTNGFCGYAETGRVTDASLLRVGRFAVPQGMSEGDECVWIDTE